MIRIEDKEIVVTYTIKSIEILDGNISMKDRYANFPVRLFDQDGNFLGMRNIEILGEEYDAWNSDDYIENIILSKLEMVKSVPEPVVEPVVEPVTEPTVDTTDTSVDSTNTYAVVDPGTTESQSGTASNENI